jgi:catechol 2,3-dioxygenase-like lactoylglutathione lyase family enzyme
MTRVQHEQMLHLTICVESLDRSIAFYQTALLMRESHRLDFDTFTLVYLRDPESGTEIELTPARLRPTHTARAMVTWDLPSTIPKHSATLC